MSFPPMPGTFQGTRDTLSSTNWFARALDNARRRHRMTVKELARVIGRTPKATQQILAGDNAPQLDAVMAACRAFDSVFDEFVEECGRASTASEAEAVLAKIAAALGERRS